MPKLKLTDAVITRKSPPTDKNQEDYWDTLVPTFGLRISKGGTRSWIVQPRVLHKGRWVQKRITLGRYPDIDLTEARQMAREALERASKGQPPVEVKRERRQALADASANTYGKLTEDFLGKYRTRSRKKPSERTLSEIRRVLSHKAFDAWDEWPITSITKAHVMDAIETFLDKGQERAANLYLRYLKIFFGWALDRDLISADPTTRIKPQGEEKSRERVLVNEEIQTIWKATAPTEKAHTLFPGITRVLLLTGQRRSEVGGMRWSEVDIDRALWSIPGDRTKNGRDHLVPLSAPVMEIIKMQKRLQSARRMKTGFVFTTAGKAPFSGWSKGKIQLDEKLKASLDPDAAPATPWTLHDLRRTTVTKMHEDLHIPPHIVEAIVNHVSGYRAGVAGVYNRALYLDERRRALDAWADYVVNLAEGSQATNVVRLEDAR